MRRIDRPRTAALLSVATAMWRLRAPATNLHQIGFRLCSIGRSTGVDLDGAIHKRRWYLRYVEVGNRDLPMHWEHGVVGACGHCGGTSGDGGVQPATIRPTRRPSCVPGGVQFLLDGASLYDFAAHNDAPFTYPPFAGLIFVPLGMLSEPVARVLWTASTIAVVLLVAWLSRYADNVPVVRQSLRLPAVALLLFISAPVSSNIRFGQISIFLVALVLLDCLKVLPARYRGIATGFAAAVKLTPAIFVPYWWFSGQRRQAVVASLTFAIATMLAWLVLPGESARFWLTEILNVDRVGNIATGGNQSLNGAMLRWELPDTVRASVVVAVGGVIVVMALVRAVRAYRNSEPFTAAVFVGAAGLVFSPVWWTHHQIWLVFAALCAVSERRRINLAWALLVTVLMVLLVTSVGASLPGGQLFGNARLVLAIAIACAVPFRGTRKGDFGVRPLSATQVDVLQTTPEIPDPCHHSCSRPRYSP
ncbi:MAG TPA: glycosyltransferase family 87 protein [Micromonosporaceae bacterium]